MPLITGFSYDETLSPGFELDSHERIVLKKGEKLEIELSKECYCISCGKQVIGGRECYECKSSNAWDLCHACDGKKCLQYDDGLKEHCFGNEYCVYLAAFGGHVKAGVSMEKRLHKRWFEQGADQGLKVFQGFNGQKARLIEKTLIAKGFLDRVLARDKIEWLSHENGSALLQAREKIKSIPAFSGHYVEETPIAMEYDVIEKPVQTFELKGIVRGWKGPLLFLVLDGENQAFNATSAFGRKTV